MIVMAGLETSAIVIAASIPVFRVLFVEQSQSNGNNATIQPKRGSAVATLVHRMMTPKRVRPTETTIIGNVATGDGNNINGEKNWYLNGSDLSISKSTDISVKNLARG